MSQPRGERVRRWTLVFLASLGAHLLALTLLRVESRPASTSKLEAIDISFNVVAPEPAPAPLEPEGPEPEVSPNVKPPSPRPKLRRARNEGSTKPRPSPNPIASTRPQPRPMVAIDPESAARAFVHFEEAASTSEATGTGARGNPTPESDAEGPTPNYFEGMGAKRHLSVRDPPVLKRRRDGTHQYQGHAFEAIVETDGSVTFDDGYGQGMTVRFDVSDLIMRRRGEDPYRVEKRWFLDGTEAFRRELFERWRAKQVLIALQKLRIRLLRIIEDETLTNRQKSDRIDAMMRDTSDDETGALARETIVSFVAERLPELEIPSEVP